MECFLRAIKAHQDLTIKFLLPFLMTGAWNGIFRIALLENNFSLAKELLGRPYTFAGKVVHGQHLGRTIGIPTANIWLPKQKLPISGVYAVRCSLDNKSIDGIANMGVRPTVGGSHPVLEVHLFNFNSNIYSKRLDVQFINKIREDKKFKNLDMLKSQIQEDIKTAKFFLSKTIWQLIIGIH